VPLVPGIAGVLGWVNSSTLQFLQNYISGMAEPIFSIHTSMDAEFCQLSIKNMDQKFWSTVGRRVAVSSTKFKIWPSASSTTLAFFSLSLTLLASYNFNQNFTNGPLTVPPQWAKMRKIVKNCHFQKIISREWLCRFSRYIHRWMRSHVSFL